MADDVRYLCVHCDLTFAPEGDEPPRCPRCLRKNVVERRIPREPVRGRGPVVVSALALVVMVGFGAAYALWASRLPGVVGEEVDDTPLTLRDLRGHLRRLGADRTELRAAFVSDRAVRSFFGELPSADAGATRIGDVLRAKVVAAVRAGRLRVVPQRGAREAPFLAPTALAARLARGGGVLEVAPLEVVLFAVAAARHEGIEARVAEVYAFEGERRPSDPPGRVGYHVLALPNREGARTIDAFRLVDLGSVEPRRVAQGQARLLDDVETIAAVDVLAAAIAFERDRDGASAHERAEEALRLDPRSPSARAMRALTLAAAGGRDEAVQEARAALALRPDPPRQVLLGGLLLPSGEVDEAERLARAAVEAAPAYGAAHALVAGIAIARGDVEAARAAVAEVRSNDPALDSLPMLEASVFVLDGEPDRAVERVRAYVAAHRDDPRARLDAAFMFARMGMREATITELRAAIASVHGEERARVSERIGAIFGPTLLLEVVGLPDGGVESEPAAAEGDVPADPAPNDVPPADLRLTPPSFGGREPNRPSLLGPRP